MSGRLGYYLKYFSELPEEWKTQRLDKNVVDILPGYAFESHYFDESKGIQLIRVRDIGKNKAELCYNGDYDRRYLIQKNDILIGMDGEYVVAKWNGPKALLNQRVCRIESLRKNLLDNDFLYFVIQKPIRKIEAQTPQTTVKHLSTTDIREIQIPLPPLPEQRKIASILLTVDEAIQKTNEVIGKTERLKRGLMRKLLTRGLGHKQFKQTEFGETPATWKPVRLGEVCTIPSGQIDPRADSYISMLHVGPDNIEKETGFLFGMKTAKELKLISGKYVFDERYVLYSKIRPNLMKVALPNFRGICSADVYPLKPKKGLLREFLFYVLLSNRFTKYATSRSLRTGIPKINRPDLLKYQLLLPPISEQREIASILSGVDKKKIYEGKKKLMLEKLKRGLMQVLLTGKVRVD